MTDTTDVAIVAKEIADSIVTDRRLKNKIEMLFVAELIRYQIEQAIVRA